MHKSEKMKPLAENDPERTNSILAAGQRIAHANKGKNPEVAGLIKTDK
jgi:hypothetical protein